MRPGSQDKTQKIRREGELTTYFRAAAVVVLFLFVFSRNAHAYLDPGAGSMLLQGLLAAFFAVLAYLGVFRRRLKSWWQHFEFRQKE